MVCFPWHGLLNLGIDIESSNTNTDLLLTDNYDTWHREIKKITSNEERETMLLKFFYYRRLMAPMKPHVSF